MTMHDFSITDKTGTALGTFTGRTAVDAMDEQAHIAGYWDHGDQATMMGGQFRRWTDKPEAFATFEQGLLVSLVASQPEETPTNMTSAGWPKTIEQIEAEAVAAQEAYEAGITRLAVQTEEVARLGQAARAADAILRSAES